MNRPKGKRFILEAMNSISLHRILLYVGTSLYQQNSPVYFTNLNGYQYAVLLMCMGIIFTPIGHLFEKQQRKVYEQTITYDDSSSTSTCDISERNQGRFCNVRY